jgi:hypothetical protein
VFTSAGFIIASFAIYQLINNEVKEERLELEKNSGVNSAIQEQDIKQHLREVLQEIDRHNSSP